MLILCFTILINRTIWERMNVISYDVPRNERQDVLYLFVVC